MTQASANETKTGNAGTCVSEKGSVLRRTEPAHEWKIVGQNEALPGGELLVGLPGAVIDSAKISKLGLPVIIPVAEFRDLVGAGITATLAGSDPATELKKAHEQFRPILERSEKA